jgi:hypothetical protein
MFVVIFTLVKILNILIMYLFFILISLIMQFADPAFFR